MRLLKVLLSLAFIACSPKATSEDKMQASITVSGLDVYFSPKGGCEEAVLALIQGETKEILVQAYSFTNIDVVNALVAKKSIVHVILDRSALGGATLATLRANGVDVLIDKKHPIAHNKVIITPGSVETGSYNYTNQAENNAENCLVIKYKPLAQKYRDNWLLHKEHSVSPATLADAGVQ